MTRLLWRFALLLLLVVLFTWLADRPGRITIVWLSREIQTSVVAAAATLLIGLAALAFLWNMTLRIFRSPATTRRYFRNRKERKGYESLSRGIIAAGAGDMQGAQRHAAIAGKSLPAEPLVNVLAAQAAQLKGDRAEVRRIFSDMTKTPETEALGLRGLFTEARQAGNIAEARQHAERALAANPRLGWASSAMLQLQSLGKDWTAAIDTLRQQAKSGLITAAESDRKQAALLAAQALEWEDGRPGEALAAALKAHKLDPALAPAASVAARLHIRNGAARKAAKILRETWSRSPHPDLAEIMSHLKTGDTPEARYERVQDLVRGAAPSHEGDVALARAAVQAQRWEAARKILSPHAAERPEARICALMAEIEEGLGNKGGAREWMARALAAPRDPMWVTDGVPGQRWLPVSPLSGEIMPSLWKAPFDMLPESREAEPEPPEARVGALPAVIAGNETKAVRPPEATAGATPIVLPPLPDDPGTGEPDSTRRNPPYTDG
jgi:HemY protein